jgi:hypothetical protein
MKRCLYIFLACLLVLSLSACRPSEEPKAPVDEQASIIRLCGSLGLEEAEARALLDLLAEWNLTGDTLFVYPVVDEEGRTCHHIWIGEGTVDVYLSGAGDVAAICQAGTLLWGELPEPPAGEAGDETGNEPGDAPDEPHPTTISVEDHSATVLPGGDGYVRAKGQPGIEYKIKVYYAGGVSTAKALAPKMAAEDGTLVWEWRVSTQVKPGVYKIIIVRADDEHDTLTLPFEVLSANEQ